MTNVFSTARRSGVGITSSAGNRGLAKPGLFDPDPTRGHSVSQPDTDGAADAGARHTRPCADEPNVEYYVQRASAG